MKSIKFIAIASIAVVAIAGSIASGDSSNSSTGASSSSGEKDAGAADELKDVKVSKCAKSDIGWAEATLAVKNNSSKASDYSIEVTFTSKDGKTQYGTGNAYISNLGPGQSKSEKVSNLEEVKGAFTCKVTSVDRSESL